MSNIFGHGYVLIGVYLPHSVRQQRKDKVMQAKAHQATEASTTPNPTANSTLNWRLMNTGLGFVIIGLGIGWLMGLSVSPVVAMVIESLIGLAVAIIAILNGVEVSLENRIVKAIVKQEESKVANSPHGRLNISPWPLAVLIIGILGGSVIGIWARNDNWLGSELSRELDTWTDAELNRAEVARRLFEIRYPYTPYVQSESLLHSNFSGEFTKWISATNTITNPIALSFLDEMMKRMIDLEYSPTTLSKPINSVSTTDTKLQGGTVLYAQLLENGCNLLGNYWDDKPLSTDEVLIFEDKVRRAEFTELLKVETDPEKLRQILRILCQRQ